MLCERLDKIYNQALVIVREEEEEEERGRGEERGGQGTRERGHVAVKLGLKKMRKSVMGHHGTFCQLPTGTP